jgi:uncharacterized protein YkwD
MRTRVLSAAFAAAMLVSGAASACSLDMPAAASSRAVNDGPLDAALLDSAVRAEVNYARCRSGLRALQNGGDALTRAAEAHSRWMVSARTLSHRSNVSGRSTLSERIRAAGYQIRTGSENIGYVSRYQIDGAPFRIVDSGSCRFASNAGQPLPTHSYATVARQIVAEWMRSAGHRRNILDSRVTRVATGAVVDRNGPYCGRVWFTQKFVG